MQKRMDSFYKVFSAGVFRKLWQRSCEMGSYSKKTGCPTATLKFGVGNSQECNNYDSFATKTRIDYLLSLYQIFRGAVSSCSLCQ